MRNLWKPIGKSSRKGQRHRARIQRRASIMRKRLPIHQAIALDLVRKICFELGLGKARNQKALFAKMNRRWYIGDIYIPSLRVLIEIDGSSHETQQQYDKVRDASLDGSKNITTIRFKNSEVTAPDFRQKITDALLKHKELKKDVFLNYFETIKIYGDHVLETIGLRRE